MSYGDPYDCSYLFTPYGRQKEMECYELEMKEREQLENEAFKFKDMMYDMIDEAVKLTTDLDYSKGLSDYEIKLEEMFEDILTYVRSTISAKRSAKFTDDLLKTLGSILNPGKAA
jgi:hypothetical protein